MKFHIPNTNTKLIINALQIVETDDGTQVVVIHPDFDHKLVIDSGGLGDLYSHGYDVTIYSETDGSACV